MESTSSILHKLNDLSSQQKPGTREQMLALAQYLVSSLETASDLIYRIGGVEPAGFACIRTAVELGIFEKLKENGDCSSAAEIASATGADEALIARLIRHLVAVHVIAEKGKDRFASTTLSKQFTEDRYKDGVVCVYDLALPAMNVLPRYFADNKYAHPVNPEACPFQLAHKTDQRFFPYLTQKPRYLTAFGNYMAIRGQGKPSWMDKGLYPVREQLVDGVGKDDVLLVDVGGGSGHDLVELKQKLPDLPGRLVLQDTPEVIETVQNLPSGIEAQAHDFFTEQPVKHARAYFLHSILHDWDDGSCLKILQQLKQAMKPDYSKLLLHELVVPDQGANSAVTAMDLAMMALFAVKERTEAEWRHLLGEVGFKVEKIWTFEQGTESLIEAVVEA